MIYDSIVVGAGPAGITAAVQLKRAGFAVLLLEKGEIGGLLRNANRVENFLGFPEGISGRQLIACFQDHLNKHKVPFLREEVREIGGRKGAFVVRTAGHAYGCRTVVVATGTAPQPAGMRGEEELAGTKLFYEVADLPEETRSVRVLIVGGGDAAFDYAHCLFERGHTPLIAMRGEPTCLPILRVRAEERGIAYKEQMSPTRVQKTENGVAVRFGRATFEADYVLVAVGRKPRYPRITAKSRSGIHFAGDVHGTRFRQVHIAAGDALRVAMQITLFLLSSAHEHPQNIR